MSLVDVAAGCSCPASSYSVVKNVLHQGILQGRRQPATPAFSWSYVPEGRQILDKNATRVPLFGPAADNYNFGRVQGASQPATCTWAVTRTREPDARVTSQNASPGSHGTSGIRRSNTARARSPSSDSSKVRCRSKPPRIFRLSGSRGIMQRQRTVPPGITTPG